jgi:hypothetical protein
MGDVCQFSAAILKAARCGNSGRSALTLATSLFIFDGVLDMLVVLLAVSKTDEADETGRVSKHVFFFEISFR